MLLVSCCSSAEDKREFSKRTQKVSDGALYVKVGIPESGTDLSVGDGSGSTEEGVYGGETGGHLCYDVQSRDVCELGVSREGEERGNLVGRASCRLCGGWESG